MNKSIILCLMLSFLFPLVSCGETEPTEVSFGYDIIQPGDPPTIENPELHLYIAARANTYQNLNSSFNISVGIDDDFISQWDNEIYDEYRNKYKFAVETLINSQNEEIVYTNYEILDDFPDADKYLITEEYLPRDKNDAIEPDEILGHYIFTYSHLSQFDFSSIDVETGSIYFSLCLYDLTSGTRFTKSMPIENSLSSFEIYKGSRFIFEKLNDRIQFSR